MAKFANDLVMDASLDFVISNGEQLVVCQGEPATYTDATTDVGSGGNALGEITLAGGDYTKSDGDTNGRKLTVAGKSGIDVDASGDADHLAIVDNTNSRLIIVTTMTLQSVSAGGTMDTQAFDEEFSDPS